MIIEVIVVLVFCWVFYVIVVMIVVCDGYLLLVEEWIDGWVVFNQFVGYLEFGELLVEVVVCEILEEIGWQVYLIYFVGVYQWIVLDGMLFVWFVFVVEFFVYDLVCVLDIGIECVLWLFLDVLCVDLVWLCSLLVWEVVVDYFGGQCYLLLFVKVIV